MEPIIQPVDKKLIKKELTKDKFLRNTNNGGNKLYIIDHHDSPNVMKEIGRLRELAFRAAGGGTGKSIDIDEFDIDPIHPYKQLIVWDPNEEEILGGYRYIVCDDLEVKNLATSELFNFSEKFQKEYLGNMIELGRSFVQPNYQSTRLRSKGIYALDNLWDGLGALVVEHPDHKYFFGKVTMYTSYNVEARNMILFFLRKYFPDSESLVTPISPLQIEADYERLNGIFDGKTYEEGYKILQKSIRELGENIPPLINSYMNLSPSMKVFGTAINHEFGGVEETGILITIGDIYLRKVERHMKSFIPRFIRRKLHK
jgi:hypothetical protein